MTNNLVGDVYAKIIDEVVNGSRTAFEEMGVGADTLQALRLGWQEHLSAKKVAQMPWDPKPEPVPAAPPVAAPNGLPSGSYANYDATSSNAMQAGARMKTEASGDHQYNGVPNGYQQQPTAAQGGMARAQQLVHQQYGAQASASLNAMQRAGGLALPGQQQPRPQGLQLPGQTQQQQQQAAQQQYSMQQQQQAAMQQRHHQIQQQQQQQQSQQSQPPQQQPIKIESQSPHVNQNGFQRPPPNYTQTDGADDAHDQWKDMLAKHRAVSPEQTQRADHMIRDHILQSSATLESGLMMPLNELASTKLAKRGVKAESSGRPQGASSGMTQLDGVDENDEEVKPDIKDEDDKDAINSDLDDDDDQGIIGDDDDDEEIDGILCTYDKVQRVKNKWKCVLKDGIMNSNGKEWVFHKGTGEFEW